MPDEIIEIDENGKVHDPNDPNDRTLLLEAAEILFNQTCGTYEHVNAMLTGLRLGFALGIDARPERLVPEVAIEAAKGAREEAKKYREQVHERTHQMDLNRAVGQLGAAALRKGLW